MARNLDPAPLKQATKKMRRDVRRVLHAQLDSVLNGMTEEDGVQMKVIDSMVLRALRGFGFNVHVHALHPDDPQIKQLPRASVRAGPAVGFLSSEETPDGG